MAGGHEAPSAAIKFGWAGLAVALFAIIYQLAGFTFLNTPQAGGVVNTIGTYYRVTKVTDGDTIHIDKDGINEKVRLIGINTPETVDPRRQVECFGREASNRMKDLADGKLVRLEYDSTQGERDAYGRLLAYVYLEDGEMLNRKMIAEGYAHEYTYMTPYAYRAEFRELQNIARASGRGLWSQSTCNGTK